MTTLLRFPLMLILLCLLASCWDWGAEPINEVVPPKTTDGADIMVCMVNNDLNLQVYREIHTIMPGANEVIVFKNQLGVGTAKEPGYYIAGHRDPENGPRTDVTMTLKVATPQLNTTYKLFDYGTAYAVGDLNSRTEYEVDTNASMIIFSRLDTLVAAGEFVFKAVNAKKETVWVRGYFDIPFEN